MFIESISVQNWKCFAREQTFVFKTLELINQRNGTGKTSLFEAIIFAIWGKTPSGFNLNTIRNDDQKICKVSINFVHNMQNYKIIRQFPNPSIAELYINDKLICESVRSIEDYMNNIFNYKIVSQLWTNSLINSQLSSSTFFTQTILEDVLEDPLKIQSEFKRRIYQNNKTINSFHLNEKLSDIGSIKSKIDKLQKKLKKKVNADIAKARNAQDASKKLKSEILPLLNIDRFDLSSSDLEFNKIISKYNSYYIDKDKLEKELEEENKKTISLYSRFNSRIINDMLKASEENCQCALCRAPLSKSEISALQNELKCSGRSEEKIKEIKEKMAFLDCYKKEEIDLLSKYISLNNIINNCPNWKIIIKEYDEENNSNWDKFNSLQKEYSDAIKQQEKIEEINKLKSENVENSNKLNVITEYIQNAKAYYMQSIMSKATEYLSKINNRYKQICDYEDTFQIIVEDSNGALNLLPMARLSNGEKTICALSLLFAVHNILTPEIPLLFDETFSALDVENLKQVQKFLRKMDHSQIFIITHDPTWKEILR